MITPQQIMAWAIPAFLLLIVIELAVDRWRGRSSYQGNDAINSIGLGLMSRVVGAFAVVLNLGVYAWIVRDLTPLHLSPHSPWVWISGLLLYDFLYYWFHRGSHRMAVLWAAHVVHHQSERYNLSTALRQSSTGALLGWIFYLPMALLGYPLEVFVVVALIDLLYQFWVHTEQIGKLGWFDRVFCSPSNHRAHHAVNDRYLDHNYGGILIVWDRLFGTFVEEDDADRPVYGTRAPLRSWNPLWANFEVYWAIAQDAWRARRWRDKLQVWLRPPGWRPADVAARYPGRAFDLARECYNPAMPRGMAVYCVIQFVLLLPMGMHFLGLVAHVPLSVGLAYGGWLVFTLCVLGSLMEGRRAAVWVECLRVLGLAVVPLVTGRWFGVPQLDARMALAMTLVFGASALLVPWLSPHTSRGKVSTARVPG